MLITSRAAVIIPVFDFYTIFVVWIFLFEEVRGRNWIERLGTRMLKREIRRLGTRMLQQKDKAWQVQRLAKLTIVAFALCQYSPSQRNISR